MKKIAHFMYMPLLGLGLYGGHRGSRWLRNRIKIFKQFVLPSLLNQTSKNFILWVSVRHEDRNDRQIMDFKKFLENILDFKTVFTYTGICFWDDKYPDDIAYDRLANAIHGAMGDLINAMDDADTVLMTIQPSDDIYWTGHVENVQRIFREKQDIQVITYPKGYVMDYINRRLSEWNPKTNPPFYTIKFPREKFIDPIQHLKYTGPYKSHEYVVDYLKPLRLEYRGFLVGTHGENISTIFKHPFTGHEFLGSNIEDILSQFGLRDVQPLKLEFSLRKWIMRKLPYQVLRKLRFWGSEKKWVLRPLFSLIYDFLRT